MFFFFFFVSCFLFFFVCFLFEGQGEHNIMTNHLLVKCFLVVVFLVVVSADSVEHVILWDTYNTSNGNTNFLFRFVLFFFFLFFFFILFFFIFFFILKYHIPRGGNPDRTKDGNYYFDYDLLTSSLQEAAATAG